ncbi:hypothetical protein [Maribacter cobaltidurans]|uniref:Uncharacterized protein n=1 Tax=Maribacter cobaltidurans TaxID=1178778 RepID=A0A223V9V6_9FLAO|nr:hypothetical protein [Maribacter cobaltidurans]ASV32161.1 hypothetical protein CJ263_19115 [Maribacter cobaltidurans]GGD91310.1 hypothetical protein GCM10011412_31550 [Maribacter cobaltidurans]
METFRKIGLISIPLTFIFAGIGMIWLLNVDNASGHFFDKLISHRNDWLGAHVILLLSTVFLLPTAISIRLSLHHKIVGKIATSLVVIIALTSILLAGQYAIDFVMPLLADAGGEARQVYGMLYNTLLIDTLFYKLPNMVFLALFLLTCTLFWKKNMPKKISIILLINWLFVLIGNLIDPLFQRIAIVFLAFSFVPYMYFIWKYDKLDVG